MLSELAKSDLAALRQAGYCPTDEEVIKLNDLALAIERGKDTTPANHPRYAFAGTTVLHEPTVGALEWWIQFGKDSAMTNDARLMTYFFMMANSRHVVYLQSLQSPIDIRKAVKEWKSRVDATVEELWRACLYVKNGDESAAGKQEVHSSLDDDAQLDILWQDLIATAGALHVSPEELKTCTHSVLVEALMQASMFAHVPMKKSVAQDYIAYRQTLRQIEDRGEKQKKEAENGGQQT